MTRSREGATPPPPRRTSKREDEASHHELVERVDRCVRRAGAQSVLTSRAIADRFGLHSSDLEALDVIFLRGEASPSELADATGLTSGATTALLDRLERAGYVERRPDPEDRRRVRVRLIPEAIEPIQAVYAGMQRRMFDLWSSYSARDLEVVAEFLTRSTDLHVECVRELVSRQDADRPPEDPTR
ncbi:MAG TPA: MarR family transcriptional regulator [Longimicrobiales bacterium]|nr:MarR family transcriptional regulator [Longimicrobiales bacterium]